MTAAALVSRETGQVLARWDSVPSRVEIPDTSDIVFGAGIGWESETHRIVACVTAAAPAAPHRVVSETVEFDGARVIVARTYEPTVPTVQERIVAIEAASRPSDRFMREAILLIADTMAAQGAPLPDTPPLRRLREAEAQIVALRGS